MSKVLVVLLCLTVPVLAGPGDWGATENGPDAGADCCTTWYTLRFAGDKNAVEHRRRIFTRVNGLGNTFVFTEWDGTGWGESI